MHPPPYRRSLTSRIEGYFNTIAGGVCYPLSFNPGGPGATDDALRAHYPGGWPLGRGKYEASTIPPCATWGKTNLPWSDAMGAVFISGWFYIFFTVTGESARAAALGRTAHLGLRAAPAPAAPQPALAAIR